jgi:hypothetical protein
VVVVDQVELMVQLMVEPMVVVVQTLQPSVAAVAVGLATKTITP